MQLQIDGLKADALPLLLAAEMYPTSEVAPILPFRISNVIDAGEVDQIVFDRSPSLAQESFDTPLSLTPSPPAFTGSSSTRAPALPPQHGPISPATTPPASPVFLS